MTEVCVKTIVCAILHEPCISISCPVNFATCIIVFIRPNARNIPKSSTEYRETITIDKRISGIH